MRVDAYCPLFVMPAQAGIQAREGMDTGFRRYGRNLVLFVSVAVKIIFGFLALLRNRKIFVQPFFYDVGQAWVLFVECEVIDVR